MWKFLKLFRRCIPFQYRNIKMTKEDKYNIFELAKHNIISHEDDGLCHALRDAYLTYYDLNSFIKFQPSFKSHILFPEMLDYAPDVMGAANYFWPIEDRQSRLNALDEMICRNSVSDIFEDILKE